MSCTDRIERIRAAGRLANRAGLTGRESTILVELATHDFNPEHPGVVYPSLSTLAEALEIDRKHLPALLQSITTKGCVSCVHRGGGRGNPSRYRIHYDAQPDRATRSVPRGADGRFASKAGNVPSSRDVSESAETSRATVRKRPVPRAENVPYPRDRTLRELEMGSAREEAANSPPSPDSAPAGSGPGGSEGSDLQRVLQAGGSFDDWMLAQKAGRSPDDLLRQLAERKAADAGREAKRAELDANRSALMADRGLSPAGEASAGTEADAQAPEHPAAAADPTEAPPAADGTEDLPADPAEHGDRPDNDVQRQPEQQQGFVDVRDVEPLRKARSMAELSVLLDERLRHLPEPGKWVAHVEVGLEFNYDPPEPSPTADQVRAQLATDSRFAGFDFEGMSDQELLSLTRDDGPLVESSPAPS